MAPSEVGNGGGRVVIFTPDAEWLMVLRQSSPRDYDSEIARALAALANDLSTWQDRVERLEQILEDGGLL